MTGHDDISSGADATETGASVEERVGANLRRLRVLAGLTQAELAGPARVSYQTIQKFERGERRMSPVHMQRIARWLKIDPARFFEGIGETPPPAPAPAPAPPEPPLSRRAQRVAREFAALPDGLKPQIRLLLDKYEEEARAGEDGPSRG